MEKRLPYWFQSILSPILDWEGRKLSRILCDREPIDYEEDTEEPIYFDSRISWIQARIVIFQIDDYTWLRLGTYEFNGYWGLNIIPGVDYSHLYKDIDESKFTPEVLSTLPLGKVQKVIPYYEDESILLEVLLIIKDKPVLFIAGEVEPTWENQLIIRRFDESVFIISTLEELNNCVFSDGEGPRLKENFIKYYESSQRSE